MQYHHRSLEKKVTELFEIYAIVAITGPRQSGKSTFIHNYIDESWQYYSFDDRELLLRVKEDPTLFVHSFQKNIALDEAQKAPELFHSLKQLIDSGFKHKIILSGSANFLLLKSITESLAGRVGITEMLPFSRAEATQKKNNKLFTALLGCQTADEAHHLLLKTKPVKTTLLDFVYTGGYPRLYGLHKTELRQQWLKDYISTYIERDLRDLAQVADLDIFQKVYKLLAYQTSQLLNYTNIANDLGISVPTVKKYISVLETSYQCKTLKPFIASQKKQLIKTPKIYFFDTGIVNYFMSFVSPEQMIHGGSWGNILETFVFSELYKELKDLTLAPQLYFWRTNNGAEVDFVLESGKRLLPLEVKSGMQVNAMTIRGLESFLQEYPKLAPFGVVLYRGKDPVFLRKNIIAIPLDFI